MNEGCRISPTPLVASRSFVAIYGRDEPDAGVEPVLELDDEGVLADGVVPVDGVVEPAGVLLLAGFPVVAALLAAAAGVPVGIVPCGAAPAIGAAVVSMPAAVVADLVPEPNVMR